MAPFRHILPIHNITINSNNLFVNFCWTFTFCIEKSCDGTQLPFGGTLHQRCHFKHISIKQSQFYPLSYEHGPQVKDKGRRQCCHNKRKTFPYWPTRDVALLSGHALYLWLGTRTSQHREVNQNIFTTNFIF